MEERKNFALVTGASSGIGLALSRELARRGYPLLLVSNEEAKLGETALELAAKYQVKTVALYMDLAQSDSAQKVFDYCEVSALKIEILVNNAGIFFFRDVTETPCELAQTVINLHVLTPTILSKLISQQMIRENRKGYILNIASISSRMMMPGISLYSSTKSYLRCFSRAMRNEIFDKGISITTICPGAVATGLYALPSRYMRLGIRLGIILPAERLAVLALKKMFRRKAEFIPSGFVNRLFIFIVATMPEVLIRWLRREINKRVG
ncbi:MAG: SDR family NAD(P)-dependent oxidoreductase [Treponema sp.]|nr:SDR family NAD(P)-dependent oxidoreductase [Treponema sp.]